MRAFAGILRLLRGFVTIHLCFFTLCVLSHAAVLDANLPIHDPSRMVFDGGFWWIYATGTGIDVKYSRDAVNWTQGAPFFGPSNRSDYWAPDMWNGKINGRFYLFYSQPLGDFGTKSARIGVVSLPSLASTVWNDLGTIIQTSNDTDFNTIDPCPYYDEAANRLWISFGSWFGGIYVMELDPAQPTRIVTPPVRIAGGNGFGIEASYVHYRNGWFYLFANWDLCCKGGLSTYRIVVGRSRSITGPYLDKDGIDMQNGGGTVFMAGAGDEIGPGHFGFARNGDSDAFTYHAYVAGTTSGPARLAERNIIWQNDDWPRADFPAPVSDGEYNVRVKLTGMYVGVRKESTDPSQEAHIEQDALSTNRASFRWKFTTTPEGYYTVQNLGTLYNLEVAGGSVGAGDFMREGPTGANLNSQFWRLIQLSDGSYEVQNVRSGRVLDDYNFLQTPLNPMWQWDWLSGANQRFILEPVGPADASAPAMDAGRVENAASFTGSVAPGALASLHGMNLADATVLDTFDRQGGAFSTAAGGASITVDGRPAPLIYVSPTQINFQIPWKTPTAQPVKLEVLRDGGPANPAMIQLNTAAPSVFSGSSAAIMTCPNGAVVPGANCTLWGNGFGPKQAAQQDGVPAPLEAIRTSAECELTIGGVTANVQYCGVAPGLIIDQLNFEYPAGVASPFGTVSARLKIGEVSADLTIPAPQQ